MLKLYGYFRSSATYRVRIALNYKNIPYETVPVHLLKEGGEQFKQEYKKLNPQSLVPAIEDKGHVITQSIAIMEYLNEVYPEPSILPQDAAGRARVRTLAQVITSEIHPLNNLRVLKYLTDEIKLGDEQKSRWYQHWIITGFTAFEAMLTKERGTGEFCHGDAPTIADMCLVPQVLNAQRFNCSLTDFPNIMRINENCLGLSSFSKAHPKEQPDAE